MQIWIHDNKMKKIVALNNDIPDMMSYTNSSWHSYLDQATSTFDFTIPKFSNGELHEDLKLINDECFVSFYVNGSYQVFYIATLQEDDFNIQLTCNNTNLEYALEYANPFSSESAQTIEWYLNHMDLLSFAAVEIGLNEISDRKRTLTFDSQETKMNRLQSLMSKFEAEFEFKVELNRDGTYKRIAINIYQKDHIGTDRKDVVLYYSNGLKGVQVSSDKTQMFNAGVFDGKNGVNLANVEFSEKNADGVEEFYSRKGDIFVYAPLSMQRYPATMRPDGQDNWIRKDFQTEYENVNDLKAYALRTLKQYAYPLITYTASVQSGFVSQHTDLKLGDTIRIIDKNFVGGLALEARVSEMIISFDNPANNSFVFTNYRKLDNKPSSALQTRIEQAVESKLPYRIELATTGGVTFKNNEGETIVKPSLYKGNLPWTKDVTWHWTLNSIVTDGMQYRIQARDITDTAVLTVDAFVGGNKVATTEITLTNVNDGVDGAQGEQGPQGPQGPQGDDGPKGDKGDTGNGIANTVVTYGLSVSDTTEPATWSSSVPTLVKGMYLWTRTVIIYTNGESTTSYQISYIPKDADAAAEIDKTKQELLEKLETVRDDSLAAVEDAKQQLETVRNDSLAAAEEAKQQVTSVASDLSKAKTDFQNAVNTVDTKATNVQNDLSQAKQDLDRQAQQLQEQANAQSELTNRVSSVEETANGTKTTVSELSKTVDQNGKNIASVTARTKVVEDDLSGTKTTLSQVKMTADSTSQKTATLETGLSGLSAKFESLSVGNKNYLPASRVTNRGCSNFSYSNTTKSWTMTVTANSSGFGYGITFNTGGLNILLNGGETLFFGLMIKANKVCSFNYDVNNALSGTTSNDNDDTSKRTHSPSNKSIPANVWTRVWFSYTAKDNVPITEYNSNFGIVGNTEPVTVEIKEVMVAKSNIPVDYQTPDAELEQKIAEYKQNADQNYASLQSTVQNLDGTVQHNKTVADQTAQGFTTRIESLETYKDGETTRANKYFELAKTETARQLSVERTAIAKDYVAKSTYTSDVTGIRNELTATTTTANTIKTNLANYQASNDRAVASLQSNIQEANGNISSLKTKVEAVPGQITSAVSAVEGKIPTNIGSTNLILYSADPWQAPQNGYYQYYGAAKTSETYNGAVVYKTGGVWNRLGINLNKHLVERGLLKVGDVLTYSVLAKTDQKTPIQSRLFIRYNNQSGADSPTDKMEIINLTNEWQKVSVTFTVTKKMLSEDHRVNYLGWEQTTNSESGKYVYYTCNKIERNNIATDYSPAPEDTASQISNLSSQIQQTADGITLLATKTELNAAKNELQSGIKTATDKANSNAQTISTHTTQISALNTGLNAKVSQSDFNTLSGRVTTAENNIIAKANELSSKITSVEGKIPTSVGGRNLWIQSKATGNFVEETLPDNHITGQKKCYRISNNNEISFNIEPNFSSRLYQKVTFSAWVKYDNVAQGTNNWNVFNCFKHSLYYKNSSTGATSNANFLTLEGFTGTSDWKRITYTYDYSSNKSYNQLKTSIRFNLEGAKSGTAWVTGIKVEIGSIPSDYSPAPEDTAEQISNLSSRIQQTADGMTLLATKTELNSAKTELQSGITTATSKADNAQATANSNAQTISTHTTQISALNTGLSAKVSQTDFNTLSGRVTTAENNITAKANELSSKITSVEGKIPTSSGGRNLAQGTSKDWSNPFTGFSGIQNTCPNLYKVITNGLVVGDTFKTRIVLKYTNIRPASGKTAEIWLQGAGNVTAWNSGVYPSGGGGRRSLSGSGEIVFELTDKIIADHLKNDYWNLSFRTDWIASGSLQWRLAKAERGMFFTDWSPAPEDTISQINAVSSEIKQTTDSIKASVSSLDKSTVKSSSLTINADGIVMKAGKSTTDVANAIGSYFAVNQNAINLFADKIKVKGDMIVSGSISSDKISSSGITANVIKGGTLQSTNGSTNFELNTGKLFYNNNNTGVFRVQNGASTMGLKFSNTSVTVNGTSRILSRTILGGDRRETTLDDGKWDKGGFSGLVIETIKGVEPATNEHADAMRVISDNIYFTHTYSADSPTGISAHGWKMETYAPDSSYSGNIVLKPYGINYRQSDIIVGDVRLDNGDGSGYWMRATINTLKNCFGHILNGGTSSQVLNAIRSELNKISGI